MVGCSESEDTVWLAAGRSAGGEQCIELGMHG